ncbi:MAG: SRPBCC family protein [Gemmatimonadaceae bacterium]
METEQATEKTTRPNTDRIEKRATLKAPQARVWRALSNPEEFGKWFGVTLEGGFAEGKTTLGKLKYPGYEHLTLELLIERIQPERYFSFRWHPYAIDASTDYSSEPTTLVEFRLEEADAGTLLTIVESGFDRIPLARRAEAFRMNDNGWTSQIKNIERHVAQE